MLEQLPLAAIGAIGTPGLLALAVYLILTGKIVPKATVDEHIAEKNLWRTTAQKALSTNAVQAEALNILARETGASVAKVMGAIQDRAGVDDA